MQIIETSFNRWNQNVRAKMILYLNRGDWLHKAGPPRVSSLELSIYISTPISTSWVVSLMASSSSVRWIQKSSVDATWETYTLAGSGEFTSQKDFELHSISISFIKLMILGVFNVAKYQERCESYTNLLFEIVCPYGYQWQNVRKSTFSPCFVIYEQC